MTLLVTTHHTIRLTRKLAAPRRAVFAAWTRPEALARWYLPGDENWTSRILEHDLRVGGAKRLSFGPAGGPTYTENARYEDIVENARLCFAMTILRGAERITTSMVTVEFLGDGQTSELRVTEQLVLLNGGDTAEAREVGWGETLDRLPDVLALN
jgi:uncharacterized protein YndB with AHSA1/START domain